MNSTLLRNVFASHKARALSLACVTAIGMFSLPAIASADGRYHDRGDDRREDRREDHRDDRRDNRNDDRNRSRDSHTDVRVGIRIG